MNKIIHEISVLFGKTFLVTLVVALGFGLCSWLGLPSWAQGFGLIPAGYVFCRLAGERIPPVRRWLPFLLGISLLIYVFATFLPHVAEAYRTAALVVFVALATWLISIKAEPVGASDGDNPSE
jgi:hypothetical protein